jgi:hypothetical protein
VSPDPQVNIEIFGGQQKLSRTRASAAPAKPVEQLSNTTDARSLAESGEQREVRKIGPALATKGAGALSRLSRFSPSRIFCQPSS